ncbi:MAG: sigma-70 family RNA polymerase sigma factor [Leptospiraceae bacterium]|nr:sigma-70 family RNA polymerase sigma factor [Leptospiraceae bacterium]MCK6381369.1 sigma-70 family RNA polymerase sigma factor [Leptospiraceae bacterium]
MEKERKFEKFYSENYQSVYKYLLKMSSNPELADDLTQEAFINIYKAIESYSEEKGNFKTWAFTIARNVFYMHLRKKRVDSESLDENKTQNIAKNDFDPAEIIEKKITENEIILAIQCLPEPEKSILIFKKIKNKTLEETAYLMNLSERTIRRRLLSAFEKLKTELIRRNILPPDSQ